jgi:chaperone required for assembly of F1-ATPase
MDAKKIARKFKTVAVVAADGGFTIHLDGKPAHTPERRALASPYHAVMAAVAEEWTEQGVGANPAVMPLTRLLATQLDRVAPQRAAIITGLVDYIDADVLCYRAPDPPELKTRQQQAWQPILDRLAQDFAVPLVSVDGIAPVRQSDAARAALVSVLENLNDVQLTALQATASLANSIGLAIALIHGHLSAKDVHAAAHLDELFQIERWGEDDIARERRSAIGADLEAIDRYLKLSV